MTPTEFPADELTYEERAQLDTMIALSWLYQHRREVEGAYSLAAASSGVTVQGDSPQIRAILRHFPTVERESVYVGADSRDYRTWTLPAQMVPVTFVEVLR